MVGELDADDALIGASRPTAARVVGITEQRLRSWNRIGLVMPSAASTFGRRQRWQYSLEDLVQGRVVKQLEEAGVHVRVIRAVVEAVRTATDPRPLASLKWAIDDLAQVYVGYPDGNWVNGRRPAQNILPQIIELDEIRGEARRAVRARASGSFGVIEKRRGVLGSAPVFKGTRVPLATVQRYLQHGYDTAAVLASFPSLDAADVEKARDLAHAG